MDGWRMKPKWRITSSWRSQEEKSHLAGDNVTGPQTVCKLSDLSKVMP